jgi:hypothetical protein
MDLAESYDLLEGTHEDALTPQATEFAPLLETPEESYGTV